MRGLDEVGLGRFARLSAAAVVSSSGFRLVKSVYKGEGMDVYPTTPQKEKTHRSNEIVP
jgi:hypothetical protein